MGCVMKNNAALFPPCENSAETRRLSADGVPFMVKIPSGFLP
jgi:hypothetical protein